MSPNVRWRWVHGKPMIRMILPGGFGATITRTDAWHLRDQLERVLRTQPPPDIDDGEHEH